jgi:hypothetical protein
MTDTTHWPPVPLRRLAAVDEAHAAALGYTPPPPATPAGTVPASATASERLFNPPYTMRRRTPDG